MNSYTVNAMFPQALSSEILNMNVKKISDFCYEIKNSDTDKNIIRSNRGGWQSDKLDINSIKNVEFNKLITEIDIAINKVSTQIGIGYQLELDSIWININQYGNYNASHTHNGSILSGAFYVKTPKNCGQIEFENPLSSLIQSYLFYWQILRQLDSSVWLGSNCRILCEENQLIIFPSWIKHSVEQNLNQNEDRISISFNTKLKLVDNVVVMQ